MFYNIKISIEKLYLFFGCIDFLYYLCTVVNQQRYFLK